MVVEEQEPTGDEEADFAGHAPEVQAGRRRERRGRGPPEPLRPRRRVQGDGPARRGDRRVPEGAARAEQPRADVRGARPVLHGEGAGRRWPRRSSRARCTRRASPRTSSSACSTCSAVRRGSADRREQAVEYYQRVFVVDIQFRDVGERLAALESARSMSGVAARVRTRGDVRAARHPGAGARSPRGSRRGDAAHRHGTTCR